MATYVHWKDISTSTGRMNTNFRRMAIWGKEKERNAEEVGGQFTGTLAVIYFSSKKKKKLKQIWQKLVLLKSRFMLFSVLLEYLIIKNL